jgi:hypothetical protein
MIAPGRYLMPPFPYGTAKFPPQPKSAGFPLRGYGHYGRSMNWKRAIGTGLTVGGTIAIANAFIPPHKDNIMFFAWKPKVLAEQKKWHNKNQPTFGLLLGIPSILIGLVLRITA